MDTKEHKRRRPARSPEEAAARRRAASAERQRQTAQQPPNRPHRAPQQEERQPERRPKGKNRRVVRAPDRNVPEVTYSMPKPFSRSRFLIKIASVLAVVVAIMSCLSLFFKVDKVMVVGAEKYSAYAVKEASGLHEGMALLGISEPRVAGQIIDRLPYVEQVKIERNLPGTVTLFVKELDVTYAIEALDGSWWLIASDGRVVQPIDATAASGYTRITGVRAEAPRTGQQVQAAVELPVPQVTDPEETTEEATENPDGMTLPTAPQATDADRMSAVLSILRQLERSGVIGEMSLVDVTTLTNITMEYGNRFHVVVGTAENLDYKIAAMVSAVEQLEEYEIGELDVSFKFMDKVIFNPSAGE